MTVYALNRSALRLRGKDGERFKLLNDQYYDASGTTIDVLSKQYYACAGMAGFFPNELYYHQMPYGHIKSK